MITLTNIRTRDVNNGQAFPPFVMYANDFDKAQGDLQRVYNYIAQCNQCLYTAMQYITQSFSDGSTVDQSTLPAGAQQQLGFAVTWLLGARTVLYGIANPCPGVYSQTSWNASMNALLSQMNTLLTTSSPGVYTVLGEYTLNGANRAAASVHNDTLINMGRNVQDIQSFAGTTYCQTNTPPTNGGGTGSGGIDNGPPQPYNPNG